jgi:hypothetical protein
MNRANVPASALNKLLELSNAAEFLSAKVQTTQEAIASARYRLTGSYQKGSTGYEDTRRTIDTLTDDLEALRKRAEGAQSTYSECRSWLDALPASTQLEVVVSKIEGHHLERVRAKIATLEEDHATIRAEKALMAQLEQARSEVAAYVGRCGKDGAPALHLDAIDRFDRPRDWWNFLCWEDPQRAKAALLRVLDAKGAKLPPPHECVRRAAGVEHQIAELAYTEEALIADALAYGRTVERRADAPPQAILAVKVAKQQMAVKRQQRVERRVARAVA